MACEVVQAPGQQGDPEGTYHEEWAARRKAAREAAGALQVLEQNAQNKEVRAMVADAVRRGRLFFAACTWDLPTKEVAAQLHGAHAAPYQYIAKQKLARGKDLRGKAETGDQNQCVCPCALAALLRQVGGRSWRATLLSDVK